MYSFRKQEKLPSGTFSGKSQMSWDTAHDHRRQTTDFPTSWLSQDPCSGCFIRNTLYLSCKSLSCIPNEGWIIWFYPLHFLPFCHYLWTVDSLTTEVDSMLHYLTPPLYSQKVVHKPFLHPLFLRCFQNHFLSVLDSLLNPSLFLLHIIMSV